MTGCLELVCVSQSLYSAPMRSLSQLGREPDSFFGKRLESCTTPAGRSRLLKSGAQAAPSIHKHLWKLAQKANMLRLERAKRKQQANGCWWDLPATYYSGSAPLSSPRGLEIARTFFSRDDRTELAHPFVTMTSSGKGKASVGKRPFSLFAAFWEGAGAFGQGWLCPHPPCSILHLCNLM